MPYSFATTYWLIFCYWYSRAKSSKRYVAYKLVRLFGLIYKRKFSYYCVNVMQIITKTNCKYEAIIRKHKFVKQQDK